MSRRYKKLNNYVDSLFDKNFDFIKNIDEEWLLPNVNQMYTDEIYVIPELQELKNKLNFIKSKLNDYPIEEWNMHTKKRNPAGEIVWKIKKNISSELITFAWCKMYECLSSFNIMRPEICKDSKFNSLHLCEAPGAFISALNHYLAVEYPELEVCIFLNQLFKIL